MVFALGFAAGYGRNDFYNFQHWKYINEILDHSDESLQADLDCRTDLEIVSEVVKSNISSYRYLEELREDRPIMTYVEWVYGLPFLLASPPISDDGRTVKSKISTNSTN